LEFSLGLLDGRSLRRELGESAVDVALFFELVEHLLWALVVMTSGSGMVANEHEQREIKVGDVVYIKAGERHWHGAKANTSTNAITPSPRNFTIEPA
jgi:hypothetical protein